MTGTAKILLTLGLLVAGAIGWQIFGKKKAHQTHHALGTWSEDHSKYMDSQRRIWFLTGIRGKVPLGGGPGSPYAEADLEADFRKAQKPGSVVYAMLWDGNKYPTSDSEWDAMWMAPFHGSDSTDYEFLGQTMDEITGDYQAQREPA